MTLLHATAPGLIRAFVAVGLLAGAVPAAAQRHPPPPVVSPPSAAPSTPDSLERAVEEALLNNRALAMERFLDDRAAAERRESRGRFLPSITLESRYSRISGGLDLGQVVNPAYGALNEVLGEDRFPTGLDLSIPFRHETRIRLTQPVFNPAIGAGNAAAGELERGQRTRTRAAARALAAEAQTALLRASAAASAVEVLEAALPLVEEHERTADRRLAEGLTTPDVPLRAAAERSSVQQQLLEAREELAAATRSFNQVVGRSLDTPVTPLDPDGLVFPPLPPLEEVLARALAGREELAASQAGLGAAEAGVRLARSGFVPSVAVALEYGLQGNTLRLDRDDEVTTASVILAWTLFNGGQDLARVQAARSDVGRMRANRQEVEERIRLDVLQAHSAARVAHEALAPAEARFISAQRAFELVRRRHDEGLATPLEFLDARVALTGADLNRVATLHRLAIRRVDLERAAALRVIPEGE